MIEQNLQAVSDRIQQASSLVGRPRGAIRLLAVSKTFGPDCVRAALAWGQHDFGENYVQEALDKMAALQDVRAQLVWHFIGGLQSNKTRQVAEHFDWVHSVDREQIAKRLNDQRPDHLPALNVLIQVNTSDEATKNGVAQADILSLAQAIRGLPRLKLRGLMALPAPSPSPDAQQQAHRQLRVLFDRLRADALAQHWPQTQDLDTLSMGMSADLETAIAEGSTLVRVGTAIFGSRPRPHPEAKPQADQA